MLEFWYKEKRTLADFRRGPLGPHFDGFATHLKAEGYARGTACATLGRCCQFNIFLIEHNLSDCAKLSEPLIDSFLAAYHAPARGMESSYSSRGEAHRSIKLLFKYLIEAGVVKPPKPKPDIKPHSWLLNRYLRHLRSERNLAVVTIQYRNRQLDLFLGGLGRRAARNRFKGLKAEGIESLVREFFKNSAASPGSLAGILRQFFRYCAQRRYLQSDFSGLIPPVRHYRHASLPKGIEDSALEAMLKTIPRDTPVGARDNALLILMMAYGIRGISAAQLLLDDLDWHHSRIRIRAQKGGKEVVVPLLNAVGEAIVGYLRHRPAAIPCREVFLTTKAPYHPLSSMTIAAIVKHHLKNAGIKTPGTGVRTLRHSWAIRALAHDSPIKSIADVLGHRSIDTTFIYAKADLNSLREVALPWPESK